MVVTPDPCGETVGSPQWRGGGLSDSQPHLQVPPGGGTYRRRIPPPPLRILRVLQAMVQASLSPCSLTGKVQHLSGARWLTSDGERGGRSKPQTNRACLTLLNSPTPPCRGHWSVLPSCRNHAGLRRGELTLASRTS